MHAASVAANAAVSTSSPPSPGWLNSTQWLSSSSRGANVAADIIFLFSLATGLDAERSATRASSLRRTVNLRATRTFSALHG